MSASGDQGACNTAVEASYIYEPYREKINIMDSASSIDPDQPKHAALTNPGRRFSPPVDFLFQESLLYPPAQADLGRYIK